MTQMKALPAVMELKSLEDSGALSGYASVFNLVDNHQDVTVPGCFAQSLNDHRRKGTRPKLFWSHDMYSPIGSWTEVHEDGKGLYVEGRLNMKTQKGQEAYELLKAGDIDGLSIGYFPEDWEPDEKRPHITRLKKVKLVEVSVVAIGSNSGALVDSVKSALFDHDDFLALRERLAAGEPPSIRELERGLKLAFSLTQVQAERAARGLAKSGQGEPGTHPDIQPSLSAGALKELRAALMGLS
jgi:HK97 family phage prohead protease